MDERELLEKYGLTEEEIERRAAEYEQDTWDASKLGKVIMGRPRLSSEEEARQVTFRLTQSKILALDKKARELGRTRSEALRLAVDEYLEG